MPRFRFTVRRMMVAVAIVGVMLAAYPLYRRIHRRSVAFGEMSEIEGVLAKLHQRGGPHGGPASPELADYHRNLQRKYAHAARYPWLPVAPDPPKPD